MTTPHIKPTGRPRRAVKVTPSIKEANLRRLRRIEGQIRGIERMVEAERYCADILAQVSAVHQALQAVSRELMRNHLHHCATEAAHKGPKHSAYKIYDEIIDLMYRHAL